MKRIIYLPGLGHEHLDISLKAYALRMMKAIDEQNPDPSKKYRIESADREYDVDGTTAGVVSIFEMDVNSEEEIYRLYEFKYGRFLTGKLSGSNILYRFIPLLIILVSRLGSVFKSLLSFGDGVSKKSKIQALYFMVIYCFLAVYLILLVPSLLSFIASIMADHHQLNYLSGYIKDWEGMFQAILVSFSGFMLFMPRSKNVFSEMAAEYIGANQYLSAGDQKLLMMGKLSRLIEVMSEEGADITFEIHAYSFGSVLALDALFPYEAEPSYRIKNNVTRLVTIGCPFDFIEIYWSNYFNDRKHSGVSLPVWININSDLDVLSTKFDGNPAKKLAFIGSEQFWERHQCIDVTYNMINPKRISFFQMLMFYGVRAHQMYWDNHVDSRSCLSYVVES